MKHDDWKLTAYALGELEGEDRAELQRKVTQSAKLQREVDTIRACAGRILGALAQGETLDASAAPQAAHSPGLIRRLRVPLVLAATLALCLGVYSVLVPSLSRARELSSSLVAKIEAEGRRKQMGNSAARMANPASPAPAVAFERTHGAQSSGPSGLNRPMGAVGEDYELVASTGGSGGQAIFVGEVEESGPYRAIRLYPTTDGTLSSRANAYTPFNTQISEARDLAAGLGYIVSTRDPSSSERYAPIVENPFRLVDSEPLSTFSIDVDTASYANIRRFLNAGALPPPDAVRLEEMINYFDYDYPQPADEHPFSVNLEIADCPWNAQHRLARIGIKGYEIDPRDRPAANLVFLIDVSGSMNTADKLPLVQEALSLLIDQVDRRDSIAMVVYAGASGTVLEPTGGANRERIRDAVYRLQAGGSTNGGAGLEAAYNLASENFIEGGVNRVILATDGDFNVGVTGQGELQRLIEVQAKSGIFLTVLGFGMGNLQDATLETLADKGNGNYAYIDTLNEARKVLVEQMGGTLVTIAQDVKIQVEFNPLAVSAYRLIGYENRMLAAQDFNDDRKDAGEIGAGHTVTALYEIVPAGQQIDVPAVDDLKYQRLAETTPAAESGEVMTVKLRYKEPDGAVSKLIEVPVSDTGTTFVQSSDDFAFAAAVASFGMLLRGSSHAANLDYTAVAEMAQDALGDDPFGYRAEFVQLVGLAGQIMSPSGSSPTGP